MKFIKFLTYYILVPSASLFFYAYLGFSMLDGDLDKTRLLLFTVSLGVFTIQQSPLRSKILFKGMSLAVFFSCNGLAFSLFGFLTVSSFTWGVIFFSAPILTYTLLKIVATRCKIKLTVHALTVINCVFFVIAILLFPFLKYFHFDGMAHHEWDRKSLDVPGVNWVVEAKQEDGGLQLLYPGGEKLSATHFDPYMIHCIGPDTIIVSYERRRCIEKINLKTGKIYRYDYKGGTCTYFFPSLDKKTIYTGSHSASLENRIIYEIDVSDMTLIRGWPLSGTEQEETAQSADGFRSGQVIGNTKYVCTFRGRVFAYDLDYTPKAQLRLPNLPAYNIASFSEQESLMYTPSFPLGFYCISLPALQVTAWKSLFLSMWSVPLPERKEILANGAAIVYVLDSQTLATKRKIPTGFGIRCLDFDSKRNWIYVAKYFTGDLEVYDYHTGELIGSIEVGPLPRFVGYSPERDSIFIGSSAGILEISPKIFESSQ
ncbi:MAG: hypothetical protein JEZ02_12705 [Desulfatibacillum sp.]|nr:hypothetical protein [Desulfatibacillum sp.]